MPVGSLLEVLSLLWSPPFGSPSGVWGGRPGVRLGLAGLIGNMAPACRAPVGGLWGLDGGLSGVCRAPVGGLSGACRGPVGGLSGACRDLSDACRDLSAAYRGPVRDLSGAWGPVGGLSGACRAPVGACRAPVGGLSRTCRGSVGGLWVRLGAFGFACCVCGVGRRGRRKNEPARVCDKNGRIHVFLVAGLCRRKS